jgi:YHS domain-containing protein
MKAITIISIAALSLVGSAYAGGQKPKAKVPITIACAVMSSNTVNIAKATASHSYADYKGRRYFFCCGDCPAAFNADKAKFAKAASIPTPKPPKR